MNTYRNKKTGAVICAPSPCQGGDWEPIQEDAAPTKTAASTRRSKTKETTEK